MLKHTIVLSLFLAISYFNPIKASQEIPEVITSPRNCYTILKELGEGAFGKVYSAQDSSGKIYAIKCYKGTKCNSYYNDPKREFEIGQQFDHPNIIKTYDYFSDSSNGKEVHYLVLQYVQGGPLCLFPKNCMTREESVEAFKSLLGAFMHALTHERIYLDELINGNLMLNKNFEIMVIDLASFFSLDEIHEFVVRPSTKYTEMEEPTQVIKELKLQRFFSQHPQLFAKMQKTYRENAQKDHSYSDESARYTIMLYFLQDFFDRLTDACVEIVFKSDLDRNERIAARTKLKTYTWNYEEDISEGKERPILYYLKQLIRSSKALFP